MLVTLGMAGIDAGMPPPLLIGGTDDGTLPADAALGNGGGRLAGLPVETDDGIPRFTEEPEIPTEPGLFPPDGGKLLKPGNLPVVLPVAVVFIWLLPCPGKLPGLPAETDGGIPRFTDEFVIPAEPGLYLPDGGKLLKAGNLPVVLLLAELFIYVLPRPG